MESKPTREKGRNLLHQRIDPAASKKERAIIGRSEWTREGATEDGEVKPNKEKE